MPSVPPIATVLRRLRSAPWRFYRRQLVLGAGAIALAVLTVAGARSATPALPTFVLGRDLPVGAVISADDVVIEQRPSGQVPVDAVVGDPAGRVASSVLVAGEVLVERRLGAAGASPTSALLPAGSVGVSVPRDSAPPGVEIGDHLELFELGPAGAAVVGRAAAVIGADDVTFAVAIPRGEAPRVVEAALGGWLVAVLSTP